MGAVQCIFKRRTNAVVEPLVLCGPVIGNVTETTANVLLEIDETTVMTCIARPVEGGIPIQATLSLVRNIPRVFELIGLSPSTIYSITFEPLAVVQELELRERGCKIRTCQRAVDTSRVRFVALSCDWPSRLEAKAQNPWDHVATLCKEGDCDVVLHLGDQVYTWANGCTTAAMRIMDNIKKPGLTEAVKCKMQTNAAAKLQESYQCTWSQPSCAIALAHSSHHMIWSDNDVTNDFTVARKQDGSQEFLPEYLTIGMCVYRMYQRALWDPAGSVDQAVLRSQERMEEWHFHTYGPCGVFLMDLRGNRIRPNGELYGGLPPLISEQQRISVERAFETCGMTCMILCSEIPFVSEKPEGIRQKAEKFPFLKDHWPYQLDELVWILELCFSWKSANPNRELIMIAGDIHISVDSVITDSLTGLSIRHITTSPITNSVSEFYPELKGQLNERFSYRHEPLHKQRTFCTVDVSWKDGKAVASVQLIGFPVPM
eukprot:TRINITY_DN75744_c0_g1_i1.p1 TRINITY_DN75744_c0_g1~~TRINITY_DN75744_c0_g1_i1.p1  ORF type:complete len:502 (+),score=56.05 TRINITY_DN75744_c0_g1_i1:47-1507(+)